MITAIYSIYYTDIIVGDPVQGVSLWGIMISASMGLWRFHLRSWGRWLIGSGGGNDCFSYTILGARDRRMCLCRSWNVACRLTIAMANIAFEGSLVFYDSLLPGNYSRTIGSLVGIWLERWVHRRNGLPNPLSSLAKEQDFGAVVSCSCMVACFQHAAV